MSEQTILDDGRVVTLEGGWMDPAKGYGNRFERMAVGDQVLVYHGYGDGCRLETVVKIGKLQFSTMRPEHPTEKPRAWRLRDGNALGESGSWRRGPHVSDRRPTLIPGRARLAHRIAVGDVLADGRAVVYVGRLEARGDGIGPYMVFAGGVWSNHHKDEQIALLDVAELAAVPA